MHPENTTPRSTVDNINAIARLEQEFLERRTLVDRIGDAIGTWVGSMTFVLLHAAWFSTWFFVNSNLVRGFKAFDPYPFILLSMIVSVESVLLTTFVLMKQNRMSRRAEQRAQLDLQINLLSEKEATKIIQMLDRMSSHMGIQHKVVDSEARELGHTTAVENLARELKDKMPGN